MNTPPPQTSANILMVDDTAANLQLLTGMLKGRGYKVRPVSSGEMALRAVETHAPDLILLDISMPDMDGYEVCRRLKADERWRDIPVLFISALSDTEDKVRAFQAGGVDYVGKPFQFEEVDARVRTHLALHRQQQELKANYDRLQDMEHLRDNLTHMIAHDMRSPLLALQLSLGLLGSDIPVGEVDTAAVLENARLGVTILIDMVSQMLDVSRMEAGKMELKREPCDLVAIAKDALAALRPLAETRTLAVATAAPVAATCDRDLIRRVIANLVGNAIKFIATSGHIAVAAIADEDRIRVNVTDDGTGIPPDKHRLVFEKFGQVADRSHGSGSGLGLTFCKMAVEAHGGTIGLESAPGRGSTFWFTLPIAAAETPAPAP